MFFIERCTGQQFGDAEYAVHRCADFVRHHRQKIAFGLTGLLGFIACGDQFLLGAIAFTDIAIGIDAADDFLAGVRGMHAALKNPPVSQILSLEIVFVGALTGSVVFIDFGHQLRRDKTHDAGIVAIHQQRFRQAPHCREALVHVDDRAFAIEQQNPIGGSFERGPQA